jgi:hypothetical protein
MSQSNQFGRWLVVLSLAVGSASGSTGGEGLLAAGPKSENKKEEKDVLQPQPAQATLQVGRQILKPIRTGTPAQREYRVLNRRIAIDKDSVTGRTDPKGKPDWVARSTDKSHLQWLTGDDTTACLLAYVADAKGELKRYASPLQVRRLDLKIGRWLTNLRVGSADTKDQRTDEILHVLTGEGCVVVLSRRVKPDEGEPTVVGYEVTCFRDRKDKPEWVKFLPSAGERPEPGAFLFGGHSAYSYSSLKHLSWMGDSLIVCPEAVQPIVCLDRDSGSEIWKLERPWEYYRWLIGASVWSYYMQRLWLDMS